MVVFSLEIDTFLARPSMLRPTFSSLMPRSSEMTWPPVRMAMSSSMALRRSPKPGALTAAIFRPPRSLLTTSVARASPSTSSEMMSSGLEVCTTASRTGSMAWRLESFFLVQQDVDVLELGNHLVGVGDEVGREVAAVELHAFDDFESVSAVLASSTVMTPSLPTFCIAFGQSSCRPTRRHWPRSYRPGRLPRRS